MTTIADVRHQRVKSHHGSSPLSQNAALILHLSIFCGWMLHTSLLSASPSQLCVHLIFCQRALLCQEFTTILIHPLYYM